MNNEYAAISVAISTFHKRGSTTEQINFTRKDNEGMLKDAIAQNTNDFFTIVHVRNTCTTFINSLDNLVFDTLSQSESKRFSFH